MMWALERNKQDDDWEDKDLSFNSFWSILYSIEDMAAGDDKKGELLVISIVSNSNIRIIPRSITTTIEKFLEAIWGPFWYEIIDDIDNGVLINQLIECQNKIID